MKTIIRVLPLKQLCRNQQGMASIIVAAVLIVLLSLVSLGFARLMSRSVTNSANRQLSNAATYAAQSGINDVAAYLKQYIKNNPDDPWVSADSCNDLIGTAADKGPFYDDANLSGDGNAKYSCILLNQTPLDLRYYNVPELKSQVVKAQTSATRFNPLDKVMISWQSASGATNYPPNATDLLDTNAWANAKYQPLLRLTIYPVPIGGSMINLNTETKTVFLYPQQPAANAKVSVKHYDSQLNNGQILPVPCTQDIGDANDFNGSAEMACNIIINNLTKAVSADQQIDYFYARLTPIYGPANIQIKANSKSNEQLKFLHTQAVVDVTATVSNVSKRLQARLDVSSLSGGTDDNINPQANDIPEFGLQSAMAICKRLKVGSLMTQIDGPICQKELTLNSPPGPSAETNDATDMTTNSAILHGKVNPNGYDTNYYFEYGTSDSYGSRTPSPDGTVGSGSADVPESATISGLTPSTTYHFRICATNVLGAFDCGDDKTFPTTAPAANPPTVTTGGWEHYTEAGVDNSSRYYIRGTVDPNATSVTNCYFRWDNDNDGYSSGSEWTAANETQNCTDPSMPITGSSTTDVQAFFDVGNENQNNGKTIYYQLCAKNAAGTRCGSQQSFQTTNGTASGGGGGSTGGGGGGDTSKPSCTTYSVSGGGNTSNVNGDCSNAQYWKYYEIVENYDSRGNSCGWVNLGPQDSSTFSYLNFYKIYIQGWVVGHNDNGDTKSNVIGVNIFNGGGTPCS